MYHVSVEAFLPQGNYNYSACHICVATVYVKTLCLSAEMLTQLHHDSILYFVIYCIIIFCGLNYTVDRYLL